MIKIVAKPEVAPLRQSLYRVLAVILALVASAVVMLCMGFNPLLVFGNIIKGSLATAYRVKETVYKAIPLTLLSLGVAIAFKMKFWNIGAEGQFYMGAYGAAVIAFAFPRLHPAMLLPVMFFAGAAAGGIWSLIPAFLKTKFATSETLVTLMLNYIAATWISYLQYGPWKDPAANGFPKIAQFSQNAWIPSVFGYHAGWILTIVLAIIFAVMLKKTKFGYEIDVIGESPVTARYAGINVTKIMVWGVALSGALCGIAGMVQAAAIEHSLSDRLSGGLGFTAVITTWLAKLDPPMIVIVSFLFSVLLQGGNFLQSSMKIPAATANILQGIIIFFVLGSEFFIKYRFIFEHTQNSAVDSRNI